MTKYLIRLDDACPTMHHERWQLIESVLDRYGIKPMVGIIPANADPGQECCPTRPDFWDLARKWQKKGWAIALHGYNHCYHTIKSGGLNPLWHRSEFAELPLDEQRSKIKDGIRILNDNGIEAKYFFAPSHTFDSNTLEALMLESDIRIISDTVATKPYQRYGFTFLPQLGGMPRKMMLPGIWTFCLHPSVMEEEAFERLEAFLLRHNKYFISFNNLNLDNLKSKDLISRILSASYFTLRKFKGIK